MDHVRRRIRGPLHQRLTLVLQLILLIGFLAAAWQRQWLPALTTAVILGVTLLPIVFGRRFAVFIPPEFEALAILFVSFSRVSFSGK